MADNGTTDIFKSFLETWSNIANLFAVFIVAGLVPLLNWIRKAVVRQIEHKRKKEDARIHNIASTIIAPLDEKIGTITDLLKKTAEQNEANAQNLEKITESVKVFKEAQEPINMKINYIDEFFKHFIKSGGGSNSSRRAFKPDGEK